MILAKLPIISSREMIKYLTKHDFKHTFAKGSHHIMRKPGAKVVIPNRKELGKGALLSILKKAGISKDEFINDFQSSKRLH